MLRVPVVGTVFVAHGEDGDFAKMLTMPQYKDSLFIVTENFIDSIRTDARNGGGTACIRKMCVQKLQHADMESGTPPRAVGIPTGWSTESEGFPCMDRAYVKKAIDLAFARITFLLNKHTYSSIIYSAEPEDTSLIGTRIFADSIGEDVVRYISTKLHSFEMAIDTTYQTLDIIKKREYTLLQYALAVDGLARREKELAKRDKEIKRLTTLLEKNGIQHKPQSFSARMVGQAGMKKAQRVA
jgi:hypothetical protein